MPAQLTEHMNTAPSIVILHGFAGSAAAMSPLTSCLPGHVLALDLPGHGSEAISNDPAAYTMVATVAGVINTTAHLKPFVLVGYSMGSRVALHVALNHPDRVVALALIGAHPGINNPTERSERIAADDALAAQIESKGIEWFVDYWNNRPLFATQKYRLSNKQQAELRAHRLACHPEGLANSLRGIGAGAVEPISSRLQELAMPCALIVGADDTKFTAIAHQMAAHIPRAEICVIPDAGHATHLEAPNATATAIIRCAFPRPILL